MENARNICKRQDSAYDTSMQRFWYFKLLLTPILEIYWVYLGFISWYFLRSFTDGIPFVQLRIPYISEEQFFPFILLWCILWWVVMASKWIYRVFNDMSLFDEIQLVIKNSITWWVVFIFIVYLGNGFIFSKEIPRLIIFYVFIFSTLNAIIIRLFFAAIKHFLLKRNFNLKRKYLVLTKDKSPVIYFSETENDTFLHIDISEKSTILEKIRKKEIQWIINMTWIQKNVTIQDILTLTRVYGIAFAYPKFLPDNVSHVWKEYIVSWIPIIEMQSVSLGFWGLLIKRSMDILVSFFWIIILSPLLIIVAIIIKIEDPSWPIIFKNRRIWKWWKPFELYKFRYMYWKYSVKDAYGIDAKDDTALKFEESLKSWHDSRSWPLYKIENDPRKTKFWKIIERLSIDEIPQLINVLKGDMSIIWPRPHQPREVELYDEEDTQVLTIKPGITGMAQVYGREKNSFKQEVALDRYYIENYSILLDILIFFRTFFVILTRIFQK